MKSKLLLKTKHLSVYETQKGFIYSQRRTINSVAYLCYKKMNNEYFFLLRYQPLPEIKENQNWKECYACPITGSIEKGDTPLIAAFKEIFEEGGIIVNEKNLISKFDCIATTQSNERVFHYLFDVTDLKQDTPLNDGTIFEAVSYNKWVTLDEIIKIFNNNITLASLSICFLLFKNKFNI